MPDMNFTTKHNTSCLSANGEVEITQVFEQYEYRELSDYDFFLFDSDHELIKKSSGPLFTELTGGTYFVSVQNKYTLCGNVASKLIINNDYNMSGPFSDFTVVGPNPEFSICESGSITLEAQGGEHFRWYNSAVEGDLLHERTTYTIENLQESRPIWVSAYDPICDKESDRKEVFIKVITLPLIASLTSNTELAILTTLANGDIKWFLDGEIIDGKLKAPLLPTKMEIIQLKFQIVDAWKLNPYNLTAYLFQNRKI